MKKLIFSTLSVFLCLALLGCGSTGQSRVQAMKALTNQPDRPAFRMTGVHRLVVESNLKEGATIETFDTRALLQMPDNSGVWVSAINAVSRIAGYAGIGWIVNSLNGGGDIINNSTAPVATP
jgi:hypothetical protein